METLPEVKYGYRQPSLRRGSVRLHPVKDGVIPTLRERALRSYDRAGNRLRDVIDPTTGFCVGVASPLFGEPYNTPQNPHPHGTSGTHTVATKRCAVWQVQPGIWADEEGYVIRTFAMGDNPLPFARMKPRRQTPKEKRVRNRSTVSARPAPSTVPGATGTGGRITDADCDALIKAMAKGRPTQITSDMRKNARKLIKQRQAEMAKLLGGK